jgi:hypothetical protein
MEQDEVGWSWDVTVDCTGGKVNNQVFFWRLALIFSSNRIYFIKKNVTTHILKEFFADDFKE